MYHRTGLVLLAIYCSTSIGSAAETAQGFWEKGQNAMRQGQTITAIEFYLQSLAKSASCTRSHLSLAAAYLEIGERSRACIHLAEYVHSHPLQVMVRAQLAELLWQLGRSNQAQGEFERCVETAQEQDETGKLLIHCHSRLMDIAADQDDDYGEHLHRGIGLYLLARESEALDEAGQKLPTEALLCKALGELTLAQEKRSDEARPYWYLYLVWSRLGQRVPANHSLQGADAAGPFSYLTPCERRGLLLAGQAAEFLGCGK
jgi:tetratricopeptide (TPR) repeat protein